MTVMAMEASHTLNWYMFLYIDKLLSGAAFRLNGHTKTPQEGILYKWSKKGHESRII